MRNNATFVDGQQLKFLQELDKWILKQKWKDSTEYETAVEVRTLISKIEKNDLLASFNSKVYAFNAII